MHEPRLRFVTMDPAIETTQVATQLLSRINNGDSSATEKLLPLVYAQLRAVAGSYFKNQPIGHTLQPTAVVHEAYIKLISSGDTWENRAHFAAVAAKAMRQVLVDHVRKHRALKRDGGARVDLTLSDFPKAFDSTLDPLELDEVLQKLAEFDTTYARLVELRFYGGLNVEEIAHVMKCSTRTVKRQWRFVRAWLSCELGEA